MRPRQCKKMKRRIKSILPSHPWVDYETTLVHEKQFVFPAGTIIPKNEAFHHVFIPAPEGNENAPMPVVVVTSVYTRVLSKDSQRKYYQKMKRDVKRQIRTPLISLKKQRADAERKLQAQLNAERQQEKNNVSE